MNAFSPLVLLYILGRIIWDIIVSVLRPLPIVLPLSMVVMYLVMYANEHDWSSRDFLSQAVGSWTKQYAESTLFRNEFLLVFYTMLVLSKTLFLRATWSNPFSDVLGGWGFFDSNGHFTLEAVENFILFIPFALLLSSVLQRFGQAEGSRSDSRTLWHVSQASAAFSLLIECLQVVMRLGTFQIADLFYNTAGGTFGAILFYLFIETRAARQRSHGRDLHDDSHADTVR